MLCLNLPTLFLLLVHIRGYQESRVLPPLLGIGLVKLSHEPTNVFGRRPFYRRVLGTSSKFFSNCFGGCLVVFKGNGVVDFGIYKNISGFEMGQIELPEQV